MPNYTNQKKDAAQQIYQSINEQEYFGRFVYKLAHSLIHEQWAYETLGYNEVPYKALDEQDLEFLKALNNYLSSEHQPTIDLDEINSLPEAFMDAMRLLLDGRQLCMRYHVFNSSDDAISRGNDANRQKALGALYRALSNYRIARDDSYEADLSPVKLWKYNAASQSVTSSSSIKCDEPVVLIVPGMKYTHEKERLFAKCAQDVDLMFLATSEAKHYPIYCLSYPYEDRMALNADIHETNGELETTIKPLIQQFVDRTLLPSLKLHGGKKISSRELEKKLAKLRLYSFSYGSTIVIQLRNALSNALEEIGFSKSEIEGAFRSVYSLSINPVNRLSTEESAVADFSSIYVVSKNDLLARSRAGYDALIEDPDAVPATVKINKRTLMLWRDAPIAGINMQKMGEDEYLLPKSLPDPIGHTHLLPSHHTIEPLAHGAQKVHFATPIQSSLYNAMQTSELPEDLHETFKVPKGVTNEERLKKQTASALKRD